MTTTPLRDLIAASASIVLLFAAPCVALQDISARIDSYIIAPALARGDEVDGYIETHMRRLHIPGVSLAVVRDGRIIKAQGYGLADMQQNAPATKATVYEVGSNTKQFTATAIMMLVEEGKVTLGDKITKYFPSAPKAWSRITIRHLLSHTSGIQNHVAVPGYLGIFRTNLFFQPSLTRDELIKLFFKLPMEFQAGETWAYDNTGYYFLGIIVEKASGKSFWQFWTSAFSSRSA